MVHFVPGRLPPHPEDTHPRLKLGRFLTAALPTPPASVDWHSQIADWPMYGNSDWGDCVEAEIGHHEEVLTRYGSGALVEVTDSDVLNVYSAITGFDPNAGPPGSNPTDQGTNIQDSLGYWRTTGIAGHRIDAFASVKVADVTMIEVKTALALFGPLSIGINLPASAMDQFNAGQPWDVVSGSQIEGGHCVALVGYDADYLYVVTWGAVQKMTLGFWAAYVEEAWTPLSREWVNSAGVDPQGVDLAALGEQFTELTGQPSPFPGPVTPPPNPVPPQPSPSPVDVADQALASAARDWLMHHHRGANGAFAKQLQAWLLAKGL